MRNVKLRIVGFSCKRVRVGLMILKGLRSETPRVNQSMKLGGTPGARGTSVTLLSSGVIGRLPFMEARQFHLRVAGVSYRQDVVRRCSVGERLKLVPEPTNIVDPKAVMVCRLNGEQLGYIQAGRCTKKMLKFGVWVSSIDGHGKGETLGVGMLFIEADPDKIEEMGAVIAAAKPVQAHPLRPVVKPSFIAVLLSWLHGIATL
jgi:hypothetical protein